MVRARRSSGVAVANRSKCRIAASLAEGFGIHCFFGQDAGQDVIDGPVQILDAPPGPGQNADGVIQFVVFAE